MYFSRLTDHDVDRFVQEMLNCSSREVSISPDFKTALSIVKRNAFRGWNPTKAPRSSAPRLTPFVIDDETYDDRIIRYLGKYHGGNIFKP